jgi:hypothetical protein
MYGQKPSGNRAVARLLESSLPRGTLLNLLRRGSLRTAEAGPQLRDGRRDTEGRRGVGCQPIATPACLIFGRPASALVPL